jgi:outer membrane protein assembly factor BamD
MSTVVSAETGRRGAKSAFLGPDNLTETITQLPCQASMDSRVRLIVFLAAGGLVFPGSGNASVVFKPGEKAHFVAPGEEKMNENAEELFHRGQVAEQEGDVKRAIRAYRTLVRRYPKDSLAPGALFRTAELEEQRRNYIGAAETYRTLVEKYPSNVHFIDAIEAQFRIGEIYLAGKKLKLLGIPFGSSMDHAVEIFAAVVRTAPYGKYTARAQFNIGLAREKQGLNDAALQAYQAVVDKFPDEPVAADAQYQIGYIWFTAARSGTNDSAATNNAETAFGDFLFRYPNSEKAAQARANVQLLEHKQTTTSFKVAKFYDKQKNYRAAVIYYNEVIRQEPGSTESEQAKKRIDQLHAKFGDAVLQPTVAASTKKPSEHEGHMAKSGSAMRGSSNEEAPLPEPETDASLPPPASLAPDPTTAPEPSPIPAPAVTSEASPTPGAAASPAAGASPAP